MSAMIFHFLDQTIRLVAWLFLLTAIFVPLELFFSVRRQTVLRANLLPDLGFFFLGGLMKVFFITVIVGVIASSTRQFIPRAYFDFVGGLPVVLQFVLALFIGEVGFYWSHRLVHKVPALWQFHAVHHDPERMDWLINTRMHPVDLVVTRLGGLTLVAVLGFGSPGDQGNPIVPILVLVLGTIWAFFIHANIRWPMGWLEHILSTPRFHHWHHSRVDHPNRNFASMLPIFDRVFGTLHMPPDHAWPPSYGVSPREEWRFDKPWEKAADDEAVGETAPPDKAIARP